MIKFKAFFDKVNKVPDENGCILWQGATSGAGYGTFTVTKGGYKKTGAGVRVGISGPPPTQ